MGRQVSIDRLAGIDETGWFYDQNITGAIIQQAFGGMAE
jgi:hypothetical protein